MTCNGLLWVQYWIQYLKQRTETERPKHQRLQKRYISRPSTLAKIFALQPGQDVIKLLTRACVHKSDVKYSYCLHQFGII